MSQNTLNINQKLSSSTFDLLETFHIEFQRLRQQTYNVTSAFTALLQFSKIQDINHTKQIIADLGLPDEKLSFNSQIDEKFQKINDMIEEVTQTYFQEQIALTHKSDKDFAYYKEEISLAKQAELNLHAQYEQDRIHWQLEKQILEEKIFILSKNLEESKTALVDNIAGTLQEEKVNQKKMEMWFKRRLDAIEHHIVDLKNAPNDLTKFDQLLEKVKRLKKQQPWNSDRKKLVLDDCALNQKSEVYSNGTSTPYSHYVCVLSSAASENNPLDKGFLCSIDNSIPTTKKSQDSFLSGSMTQSVNRNQDVFFESIVKKLQDTNLPFSEKEKLLCNIYRSPAHKDALIHVKLEDILNAVNVSKNMDSLSLDLRPNSANNKSKCTFKFNQKLKVDEMNDPNLEKAISTIFSQGSQKSSGLFGSLKRSKSLDIEKAALFFEATGPNLEQLINFEETNKEVQSELDKGIIQELSLVPEYKETDKSLLAFKKLLSPINKEAAVSDNIIKNEQEDKLNEDDIDLSMIQKKREGFTTKFDEKLINDSFLGNDDMKNFFEKADDELEFSASIKKNRKEINVFEKIGLDKDVRESMDLKTNKQIEKELDEKGLIKAKEFVESSLQKIAPLEIINKNTTSSKQLKANVKKVNKIPSLDLNKIKEKVNMNSKTPSIIIINTSIDENISMEKENHKDFEHEEVKSNKTEKPEKKKLVIRNLNEKLDVQLSDSSKLPINTTSVSKAEASPTIFKSHYHPRKSIEVSLLAQPRAPPGTRKRIHARPNYSLAEDSKGAQVIMEKSDFRPRHQQYSPSMFNIGADVSLEIDSRAHYPEQGLEASQVRKSIDSINQKAGEHRNTRNSWSYTIEQEQKFAHPPKGQLHTKVNSLIVRNSFSNHLKQRISDACPPEKSHNQSHFVRSSFARNSHLQNPSNIQTNQSMFNTINSQVNYSYPSSYESTQEAAKIPEIIGASGFSLLKKVLPSENAKHHTTPTKLGHKELFSKFLDENKNLMNIQKDIKCQKEGGKTQKELLAMRKDNDIKDMKPISPINLTKKEEYIRQSNVFPKKIRIEEKDKVAQIAATPVNGSAQFRARMFAPKKI